MSEIICSNLSVKLRNEFVVDLRSKVVSHQHEKDHLNLSVLSVLIELFQQDLCAM